MPIVMPRVLQRPTHNYSRTLIVHKLIILHMMEGGYLGSVAWLCTLAAEASAHLLMSEDGSEVSQLVPLTMKAWAQCAFNSLGVSLEIPGKTADGIPEARWRAAALIVAWLCLEYRIPPAWARGGQGEGICQHADLGAAGGGHHDCCGVGSPTWTAFLAMVQAAYDALKAMASLPAFALAGLPDPHTVQLPPAVTPTPTHGGASRIEPDHIATPHQTVSGFPRGSMRDIQWCLRRVGANPLLGVDGDEGPATRRAIGVFQRAYGLPITSDVNQPTLAKLYAVAA